LALDAAPQALHVVSKKPDQRIQEVISNYVEPLHAATTLLLISTSPARTFAASASYSFKVLD
jgi:hypothetical protein